MRLTDQVSVHDVYVQNANVGMMECEVSESNAVDDWNNRSADSISFDPISSCRIDTLLSVSVVVVVGPLSLSL